MATKVALFTLSLGRQGQAEKLSKSRKKFLVITYQDFFLVLYISYLVHPALTMFLHSERPLNEGIYSIRIRDAIGRFSESSLECEIKLSTLSLSLSFFLRGKVSRGLDHDLLLPEAGPGKRKAFITGQNSLIAARRRSVRPKENSRFQQKLNLIKKQFR